MYKTDIITCCTKGFPGTDNSLSHLSRTTGLTRHLTQVTLDLAGNSQETMFFAEYIKSRKPKLLIFGSWIDTYNIFIERLKRENIQFAIYWTSSPGQSDISQEIKKLCSVLNNPSIRYILFSNEELVNAFKKGAGSMYYLPITFSYAQNDLRDNTRKGSGKAVISLFCSPTEYKRKNILNSLLALAGVRGKIQLYLNGLSKDRYYRNILKRLSIPYKDFGWMDRETYRKVLQTVDIGLQVSFAESYNYVTAEHLIRAIPVIVSRMVPVAARLPNTIGEKLIVDSPDSATAIRERLEYLIDRPRARRRLGAQAAECFKRENRENIAIAARCLRNVIGDCRR